MGVFVPATKEKNEYKILTPIGPKCSYYKCNEIGVKAVEINSFKGEILCNEHYEEEYSNFIENNGIKRKLVCLSKGCRSIVEWGSVKKYGLPFCEIHKSKL